MLYPPLAPLSLPIRCSNLLRQPAKRAAINLEAAHCGSLGNSGTLVVGEVGEVCGFALEVGLRVDGCGDGGARVEGRGREGGGGGGG